VKSSKGIKILLIMDQADPNGPNWVEMARQAKSQFDFMRAVLPISRSSFDVRHFPGTPVKYVRLPGREVRTLKTPLPRSRSGGAL